MSSRQQRLRYLITVEVVGDDDGAGNVTDLIEAAIRDIGMYQALEGEGNDYVIAFLDSAASARVRIQEAPGA